jgi:hypothetical protein
MPKAKKTAPEGPTLAVKNWRDFQHYHHRTPPWIKLHRSLLDDKDFMRLPVASKALAPLVWLLASETEEGVVSAVPQDIAWRLRLPEAFVAEGLAGLVKEGFLVGEFPVASTLLAQREQDACLETEAETEKESEKENSPSIHARARESKVADIEPGESSSGTMTKPPNVIMDREQRIEECHRLGTRIAEMMNERDPERNVDLCTVIVEASRLPGSKKVQDNLHSMTDAWLTTTWDKLREWEERLSGKAAIVPLEHDRKPRQSSKVQAHSAGVAALLLGGRRGDEQAGDGYAVGAGNGEAGRMLANAGHGPRAARRAR